MHSLSFRLALAACAAIGVFSASFCSAANAATASQAISIPTASAPAGLGAPAPAGWMLALAAIAVFLGLAALVALVKKAEKGSCPGMREQWQADCLQEQMRERVAQERSRAHIHGRGR